MKSWGHQNNLAIIGASYLQLPLIRKAREMGYTTHVFAWAANDVGEREADVFYPISIIEKEAILSQCRKIGIKGVCSIASDLAAITVNYIADQLNLPGNSMESTLCSTNKHLMRLAFEKHGDPSPWSLEVDEDTDLYSLPLNYPLIVKPTDRSGSRGITRLDSADGLNEAVGSAISAGFEKKALIEEYIDGEEYSVEGISFLGQHHILAITKKYTTGAPHYIETGHMEPALLTHDQYETIQSTVIHALDSLGIQNSASHSEIKITRNNIIKIIEIGGRMGGDCIGSHLVRYSTGIDYLKAVIQVACGQKPDLTPAGQTFPVEVRFLLTEKDVEEMEHTRKTDRFLDLVAYYPEKIGKTTDSSNRAGCYIIKA